MRTPTLLAASLLLAAFAPLAAASIPINCGLAPVCVSVTPPTSVGAPVECHEVVTTVGATVFCVVGNGSAEAAAYGCQLCLPLTLLTCQEGTAGNGCENTALVLP
jgi:hypothetical protein